MMPTVPRIVKTGAVLNEPISTMNSLTKLLVRGSASEARPAMRNAPASTGALAATPP